MWNAEKYKYIMDTCTKLWLYVTCTTTALLCIGLCVIICIWKKCFTKRSLQYVFKQNASTRSDKLCTTRGTQTRYVKIIQHEDTVGHFGHMWHQRQVPTRHILPTPCHMERTQTLRDSSDQPAPLERILEEAKAELALLPTSFDSVNTTETIVRTVHDKD